MRLYLLIAILGVVLPAKAQDYTFTGYARDLDSGALLYVETHAVSDADTPREQRVVLYRRAADSAPFARKTLSYGSDRQRPEVEFTCARSGFSEAASRGPAGFRVKSRRPGRDPESTLIAGDQVGVVDAGFDEFVRAKWSELERGDSLHTPFLVPSRLDAVGFKVRKLRNTTVDGAAASVLRLSVSGAVGWFLPDIEVTYRQRDRRLLRYEGLTNIRDAEGALLKARIEFRDADRIPGPVDLSSLRALALAP
jgi:hypothetical protein